MKFLVLAICVCAASAATTFPRGSGNFAKASASVSVQPPTLSAVPDFNEYSFPPLVSSVKAVKPVKETYVAKTYVNDGKDVNAEVLRSYADINPYGFAYRYETSNGIIGEAQGALKELEKDVKAVIIRGQYQYQGPEGPVLVTYEADENGYRPNSDLLPVAPPVPEAIRRSLEWIATHAPKDEVVRKI